MIRRLRLAPIFSKSFVFRQGLQGQKQVMPQTLAVQVSDNSARETVLREAVLIEARLVARGAAGRDSVDPHRRRHPSHPPRHHPAGA